MECKAKVYDYYDFNERLEKASNEYVWIIAENNTWWFAIANEITESFIRENGFEKIENETKFVYSFIGRMLNVTVKEFYVDTTKGKVIVVYQ